METRIDERRMRKRFALSDNYKALNGQTYVSAQLDKRNTESVDVCLELVLMEEVV